MPTLFRLLTVVAIAVALVYGAAFAIVSLVRPESRQIEQKIDLPRSPR